MESMGRERRDFYQITKAAGGTPPSSEQMKAADGTGKRKKKKAERVRASSGQAEPDEVSNMPAETEEQVPAASPAQSRKRSAREEVRVVV